MGWNYRTISLSLSSSIITTSLSLKIANNIIYYIVLGRKMYKILSGWHIAIVYIRFHCITFTFPKKVSSSFCLDLFLTLVNWVIINSVYHEPTVVNTSHPSLISAVLFFNFGDEPAEYYINTGPLELELGRTYPRLNGDTLIHTI